MMQEDQVALSLRVRAIRLERFGEDGIGAIAEALGIRARTWEHFESGVVIPDLIVLKFIVLTGAEPSWLLTGEGEQYREWTTKPEDTIGELYG